MIAERKLRRRQPQHRYIGEGRAVLGIEIAELFAVPEPNEELPEPLPGGRRRSRLGGWVCFPRP